jgi:hypothetical protein
MENSENDDPQYDWDEDFKGVDMPKLQTVYTKYMQFVIKQILKRTVIKKKKQRGRKQSC